MTYQREIELVFDIASFQGAKPSSRIDLWYVGAGREHSPQLSTAERDFFVQCIRDHVRGLDQSQTQISGLLKAVSGAWRRANQVAHQVRLLDSTFPTDVSRTSDASIAIRSFLLLSPLRTKVQVTLSLHAQSALGQGGSFDIAVVPHAQVVYGEHFRPDKVVEFLAPRIGGRVVARGEGGENSQTESWCDVLVELQERLLARGKK